MMKELARLAVGILLLGTAIYLTLSKTNPSAQVPSADESAANERIDTGGDTAWQAAAPDDPSQFGVAARRATATTLAPIAPVFDRGAAPSMAETSPGVDFSADAGRRESPPPLVDQYQPLQPFRLDSSGPRLVPVQPRPSFSQGVQASHKVHTVRDRDTLQSISREYFGTADRYLDIYLLNRNLLSDPAHLPANIELRIPQ